MQGSQPVESEVGGQSPRDVRTAKDHAVDLDLQTEVGQQGARDVPVELPVDAVPGVQNGSCEASAEASTTSILDLSSSKVASAQQADRDIGVIHTMMSSKAAKPPWEAVAVNSATCKSLWHQREHLVMRDGVLYRQFYSCDNLPSFLQLVVPYK